MKRGFFLTLCAMIMLTTVGCSNVSNRFLFEITALDLYGGDTRAAEREILSFMDVFEREIATEVSGSDTYRVNRAQAGEKVTVGRHFLALFDLSKSIYTDTDGAFNPAVYPAVKLWGFAPNSESRSAPPTDSEIAAVLPLVDFDLFERKGDAIVKRHANAQLDFGAVAKGYFADRAAEIAKKHNVTSGKIDIGGNLFFIGKHRENRPYRVGIEAPRKEDGLLMVLDVEHAALATSADNERYFTHDGTRYCHILNGATARPASALMSVTIIAESAAVADAYSTAGFVLGEHAAEFFAQRNINAVLTKMVDGKKTFVTRGVISPQDINGEYTWIERSASKA